jgi:carboxyl-terminal processing protease
MMNLLRILTVALLAATWSFATESNDVTEANIAKVTATLLEKSHFAGDRRNNDVSSKFLQRYLDILDPAHLYFLESDVKEFEPYKKDLEELTLKEGDISPARKIFDRYLERLAQRVNFAKAALTNETFTFTGHDELLTNRDKQPPPKDLDAAKKLWHDYLRYEYLQEKLGKTKPAEIAKTLTKRYDRTLRSMKQFTEDQVFEVYLTALAHVYDPHSDYLGPRQLEDFSISMSLSLFGIGAVLQSDDGYCKIAELMPGGPAANSKLLKPGDRIVAVAQEGKEPEDIIEMPLIKAVPLIRGPKGSKVTLTIIPADAADSSVRKTITLVRDEIKLADQEAKARIVDLPTTAGKTLRLGVIDLPSFYQGDKKHDKEMSSASVDVAKLIEKLKKENVKGIILDLRRNGGGSLDEAIKLTGLFIEYGPVVQTKDATGHVNIARDPDPEVLYDGPLVVLTSRLSASASEILAGALQDYGRAIIVGDTSTFGKGTVQSMIPLENVMQRFGLDGGEKPGALKLTISKFYRPSGSSTQLKGVIPDVILPSPLSHLKVGESEMPDSLPWDTIHSSYYENLNRVAPYLDTLRKDSTSRMATNEEFVWLNDDIARLQKQLDHPVVSLNEKERIKEKDDQEARDKSRQAEREKHPAPTQTQYEITLKNASLPGLPAPMAFTNSVSTNLVSSVSTNAEDKPPAADITMEEAKQILADYIRLLGTGTNAPALPAGSVATVPSTIQ